MQGKKSHYHRTCAAPPENMSLRAFKTRSPQARCATPITMTVNAYHYLKLSSIPPKRGSAPQKIQAQPNVLPIRG